MNLPTNFNSLTAGSLNVKGLMDQNKRRKLALFVMNMDVLLLQETHGTTSDHLIWDRELKGCETFFLLRGLQTLEESG